MSDTIFRTVASRKISSVHSKFPLTQQQMLIIKMRAKTRNFSKNLGIMVRGQSNVEVVAIGIVIVIRELACFSKINTIKKKNSLVCH